MPLHGDLHGDLFNKQTTPAWQALDVGDDELRDGETAKRAVQVLEQIREFQFFSVCRIFTNRILPLKAPRKYFDLYNTQAFNLPASSTPPKDAPARALTNWDAIRAFQDLPSGREPLSDEKNLGVNSGVCCSHKLCGCTDWTRIKTN